MPLQDRSFVVSIDMNGNQIKDDVIWLLPSDPPLKLGGRYFNTSSNVYKYCDGTAWQTISIGVIADATAITKGISRLSFAPVSSVDPVAVGDNDPRMTNSRAPSGAAGGDLNSTYPNPGVATVGGASAATIAARIAPATLTTLGTSKVTGTPADPANPLVVGDTDSRMTNSRAPSGAAGGDLNLTYPNPGVATVGGATAADIADAALKRHAQNTDTGTTSSRFQINSGASGTSIVDLGGDVMEVRNGANTGQGDLRVRNLIIEGSMDEVSATQINIKDTSILLNQGITLASQNSDGDLSIYRLAADNVTRADAKVKWDNATSRWMFTQGPTSAPYTARVPVMLDFTIGNGVLSTFNIPHNLGTTKVLVQIFDTSNSNSDIEADIQRTDANNLTINTSIVPTTNQLTVVVMG
jgi:hypothetical protein